MRIIILTKNIPFFVSSASANRLRSLFEGLHRKDVDMELWITDGYHSSSEKEEMGVKGTYKDIRYEYLATTLFDSLWKRRFHAYIGGSLNKLTLRKKLEQKLTKTDHIVWVPKDYNIWKIIHEIKKGNPSLKLFCEMSEFLDIHRYNKGNILQRRKGNQAQRFFEETFLFDLDGFALMTKTLMLHYQHFKGKLPKMIHLPMTVDLDRFNKDLPEMEGFKKPYVAFVGVMNDAKEGVNILIKAFKVLNNEFQDYNLYLVGPRNYDTPSHLEMIHNCGLEEKVEWKGAYDRDQIPAIVQNADLLVLPRPDSRQAQGGFPTKLGEYLATGNPVVATRVGELPDYLEDGESVFFAEPGSVDSFADAMQRALINPEEAKRIGANGRKVAKKHFNKDIQAKILYDFFQDLSDNKKNEHG